MTKNKIICLVGPSGSGKTAICEAALKVSPVFAKVKTATTRTQRPSESPDAYFFLTEEEFVQKDHAGEFLETTLYGGMHYGTPLSGINDVIKQDKIALIPIDINGARKCKEKYGNDAVIVYIRRDKKALIEAITEREIPVSEKSKRIIQLDDEFDCIDQCDTCIINNRTVDDAVMALVNIAFPFYK